MDVFTKKKRSEIMSRIKSKETAIERLVFSELRKRNVYFQKHYRRAPGNPDLALPMKKIAIFIDGDFWHGYKFKVRKESLPKKYWQGKIETNIKRDKRNRSKLRREGWKVLRVWEHELQRSKEKTLSKIAEFLKQKNS